MPTLKKIVVQDFRNIELQEVAFSEGINCISGDNGEGKTNLLDAIWYLSMTKSSFGTSDRFNIRHGCKGFALGGTYALEDSRCKAFALGGTYALEDSRESKVSIRVEEGTKKMKRDDKPYSRLSEHIGFAPIVMVCPADTSLVSESSDERRRFANSVLSQMSREYLDAVQHYNTLLQTRNTYLKSGSQDFSYLDVLDARMESYAIRISEARERFARDLEEPVRACYSRLSGDDSQKAGISYRSDLQKGSLCEILAQNREKDLALGYTLAGVHRDDFLFTLDGYPIRRCGSQGQQKSFLVSLKFAQYGIMKEKYGFPPILLLDDLFDKLDLKRVSNLLEMVSGADFGQIFLTDSNKVRLDGIVKGLPSSKAFFEAKGGVFTRLDG